LIVSLQTHKKSQPSQRRLAFCLHDGTKTAVSLRLFENLSHQHTALILEHDYLGVLVGFKSTFFPLFNIDPFDQKPKGYQ